MRLPKEYEDYVHWADWRVEEPAPGQSNLLGWALVMFYIPNEPQSERGYYYQVRLPIEADDGFKNAGKAFAYRQLIKNFDLPLSPDHIPMRSIKGHKPYSPFLKRLQNMLQI